MHANCSRRDWLKTASAFGAAYLADAAFHPALAAAAPTAPVSVAKCKTYDPQELLTVMGKMFDQIGGLGKIVKGKTVAIKINLTGEYRQRLGFNKLLEKDWLAAIVLLEKSAAIDATQVQTWVWLGQARQNAGQRERAIEAYRKALELDPRQADAKKGLQQLTAP